MIYLEYRDNIGIITLDNERGNLLFYNDLQLLSNIFADNLPEVKGLVVTGKNHSFCTGLSIEPANAEESLKLLDTVLLKMYSYSKPLVIALTGHAIGAGFLMLSCADYVISINSIKAKFGLPEVKLGMGLDQCMITLLSSVLPYYVMKQLIYTSEYVSYRQMQDWRLIDEVQQENIVEKSITHIERISQPISFSYCKKIMRTPNTLKMEEMINKKCFCSLAQLINKNLI